jgi:hypothetical protein
MVFLNIVCAGQRLWSPENSDGTGPISAVSTAPPVFDSNPSVPNIIDADAGDGYCRNRLSREFLEG